MKCCTLESLNVGRNKWVEIRGDRVGAKLAPRDDRGIIIVEMLQVRTFERWANEVRRGKIDGGRGPENSYLS